MIRATPARDMDELEGTLLPMATQVLADSSSNSNNRNTNANAFVATVIPSIEQMFDYDLALAADEQQFEDIQAIAVPDNANQLNYAGVSDDSKTAVGKAQQSGAIRCEEELESIRNANRKIFAHNYHEKNSVKTANERAKQRVSEGFQMREDVFSSYSAAASNTNAKERTEETKTEQQPRQKGYQIKDYDCGVYETSHYEVTEYKSVYD